MKKVDSTADNGQQYVQQSKALVNRWRNQWRRTLRTLQESVISTLVITVLIMY